LDPKQDLKFGVNESYTLQIEAEGPNIWVIAGTAYGALYAFETLSHLIEFNHQKDIFVISDTPILISDAPRFSHRGLMIDTTRQYLPVVLIKNLASMMR